MLRACAGHRNAETILLTGAMFSPQEALELGLIDRIVPGDELLQAAIEEARIFGSRDPQVFASMKKMLRGPVVEEMRRLEADSIREFVDIWYTESTREQLKKIEIRK
jgi:enoyl-CoA hydratase/carnithine racemase